MEILGCFLLLLVLALVDFIGAWVVMSLWNWLMPYLFGLPEINFWMAFGLMVLVSILFPKKSSK